MRISDWSSDVCSSDLEPRALAVQYGRKRRKKGAHRCVVGLFVDDPFQKLQVIRPFQRTAVNQQGHAHDFKVCAQWMRRADVPGQRFEKLLGDMDVAGDRKSTRLNSSH